MAILHVPDRDQKLTEPAAIKSFLAERGVWFDQWEAGATLAEDADQETVLQAYEHVLKPYMNANGYQTADVISVHPNLPNLDVLKNKFLTEHTHSEDEVRFFVDGEGLFWFNLENGEPVFCVICQKGDLISVPANTKHWFDFGPKLSVKAIRVFIDQSGWVPHYTDSGVDQSYNALGLSA
ncbi:MAG: cupin domain-containing protein [Saprospiraceae bacterium]|nr:cupin domain-containing protein [Saprospiraceae bacterium]